MSSHATKKIMRAAFAAMLIANGVPANVYSGDALDSLQTRIGIGIAR